MASLRQLFDSLSSEQRRNQDLLVSLGFALRSFTNLQRFLELVPVVASRLVGVEGALLVPFQADGRLWRDQLQGSPAEHVVKFSSATSESEGVVKEVVGGVSCPCCSGQIQQESNAVEN